MSQLFNSAPVGGGAPVHVAAGFHFLKPGQAGLGGDHGVDGLADGLLVDLANIDLHAFGSADDQLALGLQLALDQGLVGVALAFGRLPGPAALALLVGLLVQVQHAFKHHTAAATEREVGAAGELAGLVQLVAAADQREVAAGFDLGALLGYAGDGVATKRFAPEGAFGLFLVEVVIKVLCRHQRQLAAGNQIGLLRGFRGPLTSWVQFTDLVLRI